MKIFEYIKHGVRIVRHLLIKFTVCVPLMIVGVPYLAVGLLFVDKNATTLPWWLRWFDNADDDGLIGDRANQDRNRRRGIDPNGYLAKLLWLGFRNNLNYFKYRIVGLKVSDIVQQTVMYEKADIPGEFVGDYRSGGTRYVEVMLKDGSRAYEYYLVWPYHLPLLNKPLCFRARIGWKIGNPVEPNKQREYVEWAGTINPFCPYRGKFVSDLKLTPIQAEVLPASEEKPFNPEWGKELKLQNDITKGAAAVTLLHHYPAVIKTVFHTADDTINSLVNGQKIKLKTT